MCASGLDLLADPSSGSNPESAALQRGLNDRPNIRLRGVAENLGPGGVVQNIM